MNNKLNRLLGLLFPCILLGIAIAIAVSLLIVFSYVVIWGVLFGGIMWLVVLAKNYLFPAHPPKKKGRVIDYDDKE